MLMHETFTFLLSTVVFPMFTWQANSDVSAMEGQRGVAARVEGSSAVHDHAEPLHPAVPDARSVIDHHATMSPSVCSS